MKREAKVKAGAGYQVPGDGEKEIHLSFIYRHPAPVT
jgi:hypothetical protein